MSVRQQEQLRRAIALGAHVLGWGAMVASSDDPLTEAVKDLNRLGKRGHTILGKELAEEYASKKIEITQLEKIQKQLAKAAVKHDWNLPFDIDYRHTARAGSDGYVTKIVTPVVTTANEAQDVIDLIEKRKEAWNKLREHMLVALKAQQKVLAGMKDSIPGFIDSAKTLVLEVFDTLH
ncbi:MAG: hypothetical protein HN396_01295 [Gemmatimonadales bacterium]|nr:hypothetical protein [Gemmatimonadales bacterium]MBT3500618.1 hypothetical protein [Gemmatimonadales bacterium]MBT3959045.1 hypothetical protein [Gemmatimonadales bacterium]MBT4914818.1 hypothetical protein [Gemmatimonadales bacterium]MBT5045806.1 hypothetical protein [Gemmatimonadales bacterium]